jgi:hypothetical protein
MIGNARLEQVGCLNAGGQRHLPVVPGPMSSRRIEPMLELHAEEGLTNRGPIA